MPYDLYILRPCLWVFFPPVQMHVGKNLRQWYDLYSFDLYTVL